MVAWKRRRTAWGALLAMAVTLVVGAPAGAAPTDVIALASDKDALYLMQGDGRGDHTFAQLPYDDVSPPMMAWSPDATRIAVGHGDGDVCVVTVFTVASRASRVLSRDAGCDTPTWSPDSLEVAFSEAPGRLTVAAADGSRRRVISTGPTTPLYPSWSPTGSHIAYFHPVRDGDALDLYVMRSDGTGRVQLTFAGSDAADAGSWWASWRPDGEQLAYDRLRSDFSDVDVWTSDPSGRERQPLLDGPYRDFQPEFSRDGTTIAFIRDGGLATMAVDGSDLMHHTVDNGFGWAYAPSWSPSGDTLLFLEIQDRDDGTIVSAQAAIVPARGGERKYLSGFGVFSGGFAPVGVPPARDTALACPEGRVPEDGFHDVEEHHPHEDAIDCASWWELLAGVEEGRYEPSRPLTRGQMASIVAKVIVEGGGDLPMLPDDHFQDDDGSVHEDAINQLAEIGVVNGTSPTTFSPAATVTRAQMASFLRAAFEYTTGERLPDAVDHFGDDRGSVHEPAINAIAEAGFASGHSPGHYAPSLPVSRAQVAAFLVRVLDLHVERGEAVPPDEQGVLPLGTGTS